MSEIMQSTEMQHETDESQSHDAAPMSEFEIGAMFDAPEADENETDQQEGGDDAAQIAAKVDGETATTEAPIPAPTTWNESDQEEFSKLPRPVQEKILAREKERDAYLTRKTQEIADKGRQLQSLEVLGEVLRKDPGLRDHLAAYGKQEAPKPPDDPFERISWEAEQRALAKVNEQIAPLVQQIQHKQAIDSTLAIVNRDPHKDDVYGEIGKMLQTLPPELREQTYTRLDSDPAFFSQTYDYYRSQVTARPKVAPKEEAQAPKPVTRTTKAPLLEAPGAEQPVESRKRRFTELKSRAYDGDTAALGALFDM